MRVTAPIAVLAALALAAAGCSSPSRGGGSGAQPTPHTHSHATATRTIAVEMVDVAFRPSAISVKAGEPVHFVFTNHGKITHDAFVGDAAAQAQHEKEMRAAASTPATTAAGGGMSGMTHAGHSHSHAGSSSGGVHLSVAPGATSELDYTFAQAGSTYVGCHEPGHWNAGMRLRVTVQA